MGSIAQEMGHDLTIMYFIDKVLKPKEEKEDFFIIHSAIGPKRDIHYWNPEHDEYTSGKDTSRDKFIPEWDFRRKLSEEEIKKLIAESVYWNEAWYKKLSEQLGRDLKEFADKLCAYFETIIIQHFPEVNKLPDFIGVKDGKITSIGEIKFEYLPNKALNEFLAYKTLAQQHKVSFYLVFPKKGYLRTDFNWLSRNLPDGVEFYPFEGAELKPLIVPNYRDIQFIRWIP